MFAKIAILVAALAGAHAGIVGSYGTIGAPAYGAAIAAPAIAAPAYGLGLGLGYGAALAAPVAKVAAVPVVSSYSTVTKHIAAAPIAKTIVAAPAYSAAIAAPSYGLGYGASIAASSYGLGYGAALAAPVARISAAPVVSSYGNIW